MILTANLSQKETVYSCNGLNIMNANVTIISGYRVSFQVITDLNVDNVIVSNHYNAAI